MKTKNVGGVPEEQGLLMRNPKDGKEEPMWHILLKGRILRVQEQVVAWKPAATLAAVRWASQVGSLVSVPQALL